MIYMSQELLIIAIMFLALVLLVVITCCGTILTYLYDDDAPFAARLCAGAIIGQCLFGVIGFWIASLIGLGITTIVIATISVALSFALLTQSKHKTVLREDLRQVKRHLNRFLSRPTSSDIFYFCFYFFVGLMLWFFYNRAMVVKPEGIFVGAENNRGDLPFHLGVINSFVFGQNFPPEHLAYSGARFTYPFVSDFIAATFVYIGAEIQDAMWLQNMFLTLAMVGVLHYYAWKLTKDKLASVITPVLLLFSGGFGWLSLFIYDMQKSEQGFLSLLWNLKHDYTIIPETTLRWGNSLTTLFITQRSILLGLPLSIIIFTIVWKIFDECGVPSAEGGVGKENPKKKSKIKKSVPPALTSGYVAKSKSKIENQTNQQSAIGNWQSAIVAGALTGLLPLIHAHTFAAVVCVVGFLALVRLKDWKMWIWFFIVAFVLAAPQLFWVTRGASAQAKSFVEVVFGWDKGEENFIIFWFKNTGFFIPLLLAALCWRGKDYLVSRSWLLFYTPFIFLFIAPNVLKLAPWIWDNIKVLIHWYVASIPLVAIVLSRLWKRNNYGRGAMVTLLFCLTFAGALDVWRIASKQFEEREYDRDAIIFAEKIKQETPPRSLILSAPTYNTPVFLTGRRLFLGYVGHVWSHGIDYVPREQEVNRIYSGDFDAMEILRRNKINYIIASPLENDLIKGNETFFASMNLIVQVGAYRLYKVE
jgi:hypothetical protein